MALRSFYILELSRIFMVTGHERPVLFVFSEDREQVVRAEQVFWYIRTPTLCIPISPESFLVDTARIPSNIH